MDKAKAKKIFWIAAGSLVAIFLIVGLIRYGAIFAFFMVYPWILSHITDTFLNENIAKAIAIGATVFLLITIRYLILFQPKWKQFLGYLLLSSMVIAHLLFVASVTKEQYFSVWTGEAQKYYTVNPIDGTINIFDKPVHDLFGTKAKPITPAVARDIAIQKRSNKPQTEIPTEKIVNFFDPYSGDPLIWFTKYDDGSYHFFMRPGFDPKTGRELSPLTKEAMDEYLKPATVTPKTYAAQLATRSKGDQHFEQKPKKLGAPLKLISHAGLRREGSDCRSYEIDRKDRVIENIIDGNYNTKTALNENATIIIGFNDNVTRLIEEVVIYTSDNCPISKINVSYSMERPNRGFIEIGEFDIEKLIGPQYISLSKITKNQSSKPAGAKSVISNQTTHNVLQKLPEPIKAKFLRFDIHSKDTCGFIAEIDVLEAES